MGTSLWLVPSPYSPEATALQDVITSLSERHTSPSFPPHITLASLPACISLPEMISCLSSEEQLKVSFENIRTGQTFYQSVFAVTQSSMALSHLHEHVHKTLGVQPKTPDFAHLSLYYGDESKAEIARKLKADGIVQVAGRGGVSIKGIHNFLVEEVWVVNCQGRPEDWIVVEKIPLKKQSSIAEGA